MRQPVLVSSAEELARAHWVEGHVVFPAGTPSDEVCSVVAQGRAFANGSIHRCRVGPDGRFRVAFSPKAKAGWIALEGRYLHLQARARWLLASPAGEVTLEPELGSVLVGRLILPAGVRARCPGGEIELHGAPSSDGRVTRRAPLHDGEFVFERVASREPPMLEYRGALWLGRSPPFELAPGLTEHRDLELVAGVVLGGKVRDERGRGIARARIVALDTCVQTLSLGDGSFRLPALEAGERRLSISRDGYLPMERALGSFRPAARRTNLVFVLERGASISGTITLPDGSPAEADLRIVPEEEQRVRSPLAHSAPDGTFRVQGLLPGTYRVKAWKLLHGRKIETLREHVPAGTEDLVLELGHSSTLALEVPRPPGDAHAERPPNGAATGPSRPY